MHNPLAYLSSGGIRNRTYKLIIKESMSLLQSPTTVYTVRTRDFNIWRTIWIVADAVTCHGRVRFLIAHRFGLCRGFHMFSWIFVFVWLFLLLLRQRDQAVLLDRRYWAGLLDMLQKTGCDNRYFILACLAHPLRILGDGRGGTNDKGNSLVDAVTHSPAKFTNCFSRGLIVAGAESGDTQHLSNAIPQWALMSSHAKVLPALNKIFSNWLSPWQRCACTYHVF